MDAFTIRDIENLCGIRAHTLRVWEQRYQFLRPRRKAGNHRIYDSEDLKGMLRIAFLYHHGHKISFLAGLKEQELDELILKHLGTGGSHDLFIHQLLEASLDLDQDAFDRTLHSIFLHLGFDKAITEVIYPYLDKIGVLWLTGHVVPAQEHFAGALISAKLQVAINGLENPPAPAAGGKRVLLFCPTGEFHEIPLLYMRYLMKKSGITTIYFGANAGTEGLQHYCRLRPVTHLYFHLVTNLLRCQPDEYLSRLTKLFPDHDIVLSGRKATEVRREHPRVRVLRGLEEMVAFATER